MGKAMKRRGLESKRQILYTLLMLIPIGRVATYDSLARAIWTSPRAVGRLLAINENPVIIPCHRVVKSDGSLGGYSPGGPMVKRRILELEGVKFKGRKVDPECIIDITDILGINREEI
jgi:methylated-DNA-[protein]-cysteine S-methyltransferase